MYRCSFLFTFLYLGQVAVSYDTHANTAQKFNFLPIQSQTDWGRVIRGPEAECNEEYGIYLTAWNEKRWDAAAQGVYNTSDCILTKAQEMRKKTMDSAAVLLGLTPILFSTIGPSLTELGLVSVHRPLLAAMFSLGTASVFQTRVLSYDDDSVNSVLERRGTLNSAFGNWLLYQNTGRRIKRSNGMLLCLVFGLLEYLIAAAAIFNVIYTSWQLGVASVFIADCPTSFYPMIWNLIPLAVHVFGTSGLHINRWVQARRLRLRHRMRKGDDKEQAIPLATFNAGHKQSDSMADASHEVAIAAEAESLRPSPEPTIAKRTLDWAKHQLLPSVAHPAISRELFVPTKLMVVMHNFATGLAFAQIVYGTIIFSSLLFVSIADAAVILLRYLASVAACRILIAVEIGGIKLEQDIDERRVVDQSFG